MENKEELVTCAICGNMFESICFSHLRKHNITLPEYKKKFPNYETVGKKLKESRSLVSKAVMRNLWKDQEKMKECSHTAMANTKRKLTWAIKRAKKRLEVKN